MNRIVVFLLAELLLALGGSALAQDAPRRTLSAAVECAARFERAAGDEDRDGPLRVVDVCADLLSSLEADPWNDALVAASMPALSARALREFVNVLEHYERPLPERAAPAFDELAAIVASLERFEPAGRLSAWDRMVRWVRDQLGLRGASGENRVIEWLRRFSIPDAWAVSIAYTLGTLALIVVVLAALHELLVRVGRLSAQQRRGAVAERPTSVSARLESVRRAPAASRPGKLLALVVEGLGARFGSAVRDSMTGRELLAAAGALDFARFRELEIVVSAAERVTFAGWQPNPAEVESVLEHGRAVLEALDVEGSEG